MPTFFILSASRPAHVASDRGESTTIFMLTTLVTGKIHLVDAIVIAIIIINTILGPKSSPPSYRNCVPTSSMAAERFQHLPGVLYLVSLSLSLILSLSLFLEGLDLSRHVLL